jgi:hypothetical protein
MEYARWLDDDGKRLAELRGGLQAQLLDGNLGLIVEECVQHYDELFQLKAALARDDVFHLLTGGWATPAERCFFWMGGFRPSELLKVRAAAMASVRACRGCRGGGARTEPFFFSFAFLLGHARRS